MYSLFGINWIFLLAFDIWLNSIAQSQWNDQQHNHHYYYYGICECVHKRRRAQIFQKYWINIYVIRIPHSTFFKLQSKFCNQAEVECWLFWFSILVYESTEIEMFSEGLLLLLLTLLKVLYSIIIPFLFTLLLTNSTYIMLWYHTP